MTKHDPKKEAPRLDRKKNMDGGSSQSLKRVDQDVNRCLIASKRFIIIEVDHLEGCRRMNETTLRRLLANPADAATRLVYADWLEERGDRHTAELLRLWDTRMTWRERVKRCRTPFQFRILFGMLGVPDEKWKDRKWMGKGAKQPPEKGGIGRPLSGLYNEIRHQFRTRDYECFVAWMDGRLPVRQIESEKHAKQLWNLEVKRLRDEGIITENVEPFGERNGVRNAVFRTLELNAIRNSFKKFLKLRGSIYPDRMWRQDDEISKRKNRARGSS